MLYWLVASLAFGLTAEQVSEDVALARTALARLHPGYDRYAAPLALDAAWDALLDEAGRDGMSTAALYLGVQRVLVEIRCDHTKAELPKDLATVRREEPFYLPLRWAVVDGVPVVATDHPDVDLKRGDTMVAIDDRPMDAWLDEARAFVPYDGDTIWAREPGLASSNEFMGGAVDHFGGLLHPPEPVASIRVERAGAEHEVQVPRVPFGVWKEQFSASPGDFSTSVTFERIGAAAARLRIGSFVNYRNPVAPAEVYDPIFDALRDEGRDTLILDLRGNGGGSGDAQIALLRRLVHERTRIARELWVETLEVGELRPHLWSWDKRALRPPRLAFRKRADGGYRMRRFFSPDLRYHRPARNAFAGTLIVLVDETNGSASTTLLAKMADRPDTTLVGGKTGGSAEGPTGGVLFFLTLPHSKIRIRVPAIRYVNDVVDPRPGLGVDPDVIVRPTVETFRQGRDPVMERALELVSSE